MLSAGVADVVLKFLQSEMPPVQFKLLGTLRMLIDTQGKYVCSFSTEVCLKDCGQNNLLGLLQEKRGACVHMQESARNYL